MENIVISFLGAEFKLTFVCDPIVRDMGDIHDDKIDITCDFEYVKYNGSIFNKIMMANNVIKTTRDLFNIMHGDSVQYRHNFDFTKEENGDQISMKCVIDIVNNVDDLIDRIVFFLIGTSYPQHKIVSIVHEIEKFVKNSAKEVEECRKMVQQVMNENAMLQQRLKEIESLFEETNNNYKDLVEAYQDAQLEIETLTKNTIDTKEIIFIPGCEEIELQKPCALYITKDDIGIKYISGNDDVLNISTYMTIIKKRYKVENHIDMNKYIKLFVKSYNVVHLVLLGLEIENLDCFKNNKGIQVLKIINCEKMKDIGVVSTFTELINFKISGKRKVNPQGLMKSLSMLSKMKTCEIDEGK